VRARAAALRAVRAAAVLLAAVAVARADAPETAAHPILITAAGPFSGQYAGDGEEIRRAAAAAVAAINDAGGLLGSRLTLEVADDGCDRARAAAAAERLAALRPALVVGHPCSSAAIAAARVYAQAGLLMISSGARHPDLTSRRAGPGIFRLAGREDAQGAAAAVFLREHANGGRVAIVHDRTAAARSLTQAALAALADAGAPAPLVLTIIAGEKDYGPVAARLAHAHVGAIFIAGFPIEVGILLRQLRAAGSAAVVLGPDFAATRELAEVAGNAAEGVCVLLPYEPRPSRAAAPNAARVEEVSVGDARPSALSHRTVGAIQAWAEAVRRAGTLSPQAVAAMLNSETLPTAIGPVSFDARGDVRLPSYETWVWRGGTWTPAR
jgi:branched-chain amino acid transport system substrate-binding protein